MNNNVKIHLTIEMESGALVRKGIGQEYSVNPEAIESARKESGVILPDKFIHRNLVNKPSFKTIQINEEAYYYFQSFDSRPQAYSFKNGYWKNWGRMTAEERLVAHLNIICISEGGKSFTFEVFED